MRHIDQLKKKDPPIKIRPEHKISKRMLEGFVNQPGSAISRAVSPDDTRQAANIEPALSLSSAQLSVRIFCLPSLFTSMSLVP